MYLSLSLSSVYHFCKLYQIRHNKVVWNREKNMYLKENRVINYTLRFVMIITYCSVYLSVSVVCKFDQICTKS